MTLVEPVPKFMYMGHLSHTHLTFSNNKLFTLQNSLLKNFFTISHKQTIFRIHMEEDEEEEETAEAEEDCGCCGCCEHNPCGRCMWCLGLSERDFM